MSASDPRYPIYIISKGRWESRLTSKALEAMHVPYRIVVEPQDLPHYAAVIDRAKILVLPFANLGHGSIPARNWVWDHAAAGGCERHWIIDDNIRAFYRFHENQKWKAKSGAIFQPAEDFVDRYTNVPMAGFQYEMFVLKKMKHPPFILNTRVYSCILLSNEQKHRIMWRGRYNEDTDLSLRYLKAGYCTVLFNAFLADKTATMRLKGGNTTELYRRDDHFDGRLAMAQSLQKQHPDVVKITWKWNRWQHVIDYRSFKANRLIRRSGVVIPKESNNYGMVLHS